MRAFLVVACCLLSLGRAWADPLIVLLKPDMGPEERRAVLAPYEGVVLDEIPELGLVVLKAPKSTAFKAKLLSEPQILRVEDDYYENWLVEMPALQQVPMPTLNDVMGSLPKFQKTDTTQGEFPWGIERVKAKDAWAQTTGAGVKVAVVDTGIDYKHPDLSANYAGGYNAVDSGAPPMDDHGHGTHVAGTIAAAHDGSGVVGVAPGAELYAVKVLDADGGGRLTSIIKGLVWCGNHGMQVANMSLGSPTGSLFMKLAIMYAKSKGVIIIAAAGNSGGKVSYPGAYEEVLSVAASDSKDNIAKFSSRGKQVDFIAPGVDVQSTLPGGKYGRFSGTSMATPHVAGLAALAVSQGAQDFKAVAAALRGAAEPIEGLKPEEQGAGMINAGKLLH